MQYTVKIALVMMLLFGLVFLLSCADKDETKDRADDENGAAEDNPESGGKQNEDKRLYDNLPGLDFGGYEYRILNGEFPTMYTALFPEEAIGEVLNDAFYTRNKKIEERLNINLKVSEISVMDTYQLMRNHVTAGSYEYDAYMQVLFNAYPLAVSNILYPVGNLPHVDLSRPYWCGFTNEQLTIGGKQYIAFSDEMLSLFEAAVVVYFNKKQTADLQLDNFYDLVKNGNWTHDKLYENAKAAIKDADGDGKFTEADYWGILSEYDYLYVTFWISAGEYMVKKDDGDIPYFAVPGNQKMLDIGSRVISEINSLKGMLMDTTHVNLPNYSSQYAMNSRVSYFSSGHGLFSVGAMSEMKHLRDMPDDFGVLPFPKYSSDQPRYYTRVCGGFPFVIPATAQRPDIAGAVLEAMACESRNAIIPAYYEYSLKNKFSRDIETEQMLDLIYSTRVFDLGDVIWYNPIRLGYSQVFDSGKDTFVSYTEKNTAAFEKAISKSLEEIMKN
jgi:ABC-type glycerol-3-phosphate transport system substrate-binding protein